MEFSRSCIIVNIHILVYVVFITWIQLTGFLVFQRIAFHGLIIGNWTALFFKEIIIRINRPVLHLIAIVSFFKKLPQSCCDLTTVGRKMNVAVTSRFRGLYFLFFKLRKAGIVVRNRCFIITIIIFFIHQPSNGSNNLWYGIQNNEQGNNSCQGCQGIPPFFCLTRLGRLGRFMAGNRLSGPLLLLINRVEGGD